MPDGMDNFIPKIPVAVYFVGPWNGKCWYIWHIKLPFGVFCCDLEYFVAIWYMYSGFGMFQQEKIWQP
jgi:hypothetical protein